ATEYPRCALRLSGYRANDMPPYLSQRVSTLANGTARHDVKSALVRCKKGQDAECDIAREGGAQSTWLAHHLTCRHAPEMPRPHAKSMILRHAESNGCE